MIATRRLGLDFLLERIYGTGFKKIPLPVKPGFGDFLGPLASEAMVWGIF
jgi:hypothetical protein